MGHLTIHICPCDIRSKLAVPITLKDNHIEEARVLRIAHMVVDMHCSPTDCEHEADLYALCYYHGCCASERVDNYDCDFHTWLPIKGDIYGGRIQVPSDPDQSFDYPVLWSPESDNRPSDEVVSKSKALWDVCAPIDWTELKEWGPLMESTLRDTTREMVNDTDTIQAQIELKKTVTAKGPDGKPLMEKCLCRMMELPDPVHGDIFPEGSVLRETRELMVERWTIKCWLCNRRIPFDEMCLWNGRVFFGKEDEQRQIRRRSA